MPQHPDQPSQYKVGCEPPYVEVQERPEFLPGGFRLVHFVVLCGEGEEQASRDGKAAACACHEADDEDAPDGEDARGGRREGHQVERLQEFVQCEYDKEGNAYFHPFPLGKTRRRIATEHRVARLFDDGC